MSAGGGPQLDWVGEDEFRLAGATFDCRPVADGVESTTDRLCIRKPREVIEMYERLIADIEPRNLFEVGIFEGGSTALLAEIANLRKLVAVDIKRSPNAALDQFLRDRAHDEQVGVHWGVDQADGLTLTRIYQDEFGSEALDLVIDDASHFLAESRRTFEALFPLLREGGIYVLEDWAWAHAAIDVWETREPLSVLTTQLVLMAAHRPDVVSSVEVTRPWTVIHRGPAEIDPASFRAGEVIGERGRKMVAAMTKAGTEKQSRWSRR